jgi:hypothetical protein
MPAVIRPLMSASASAAVAAHPIGEKASANVASRATYEPNNWRSTE